MKNKKIGNSLSVINLIFYLLYFYQCKWFLLAAKHFHHVCSTRLALNTRHTKAYLHYRKVILIKYIFNDTCCVGHDESVLSIERHD